MFVSYWVQGCLGNRIFELGSLLVSLFHFVEVGNSFLLPGLSVSSEMMWQEVLVFGSLALPIFPELLESSA